MVAMMAKFSNGHRIGSSGCRRKGNSSVAVLNAGTQPLTHCDTSLGVMMRLDHDFAHTSARSRWIKSPHDATVVWFHRRDQSSGSSGVYWNSEGAAYWWPCRVLEQSRTEETKPNLTWREYGIVGSLIR